MNNKQKEKRNKEKKTSSKDKKNRKKPIKTLNTNKIKILPVEALQPKDIWALQKEQLLKWKRMNK